MTTAALDRLLDLETANGGIRLLAGTAPADATLDMSTANGSIIVFGVRRVSSWQQVFGSGEPLIKLTTRNGNVTVAGRLSLV